MSLGGQAKLLRVLEEKIVVRVGGSKPIHTDARVIAATNQNLAEMVRAKQVSRGPVLPAERGHARPAAAARARRRRDPAGRAFLADFSRKARRKPPKFTAAARKRLRAASLAGQRPRAAEPDGAAGVPCARANKIDADDLAFILSPRSDAAALPRSTCRWPTRPTSSRVEYIKQPIERARGNMTDAAEKLGLHRSNLYRKMRQLGMHVDDEKE